MSATFVSVFILVSSLAVLFFWLRAACRAILQEKFEQDYSENVAAANQLEFLEIRRALQESPEDIANYTGALTALERDYEALTYLLGNAGTVDVGKYTRGERLLMLDFQLLRVWVRLKRLVGVREWRSNLLEMTEILSYLGNVMGQRLLSFPTRLPLP